MNDLHRHSEYYLRIARSFSQGIAAVLILLAPLGASRADDGGPDGNPVTYSRDIAPIFQKACQQCHRPGEMAPMSLLSFADARPWAKSIKAKVAARKMPPWDADRSVGKFINDPSLTDAEIEKVVRWVDVGAPEGDPAELPIALTFKPGWTIGKPDLILTIPNEMKVDAGGPDRFEFLDLPTGLTEDRWVEAVEVRPGNRKVVHHVMVYMRQDDDDSWEWGHGHNGNLLSEFAVGNNGDLFPDGTGRLLKAGSSLLVEIHYHPNGAATTDRTSIGLKFHPKGEATRRVVARPISSRYLHVPAGAPDVESEAEYTFSRPFEIISFQPHMHCRGKDMKLEAVYPDGRTELLCSVPHFNFNWQITYTYKTPPKMPAGTSLRVFAHHDNSAANPNNPNPAVDVYWGPETTDEMMIGWTDIVYLDDAPSANSVSAGN